MKAQFISIDGIEGAGKSTQITFIEQYLQNQGIQTLRTHEPGGSLLGEQIREILLDKTSIIDINTELLLMFAARNEHIESTIKPALAKGIWVISDRFTDASYAYQGGGRGLSMAYIAQIEQIVIREFQPDLSLFLDIPIEVVLDRIEKRGNLDRFELESKQFFRRVRNVFLTRAEHNQKRIKLIDGNRDITVIQADIAHLLQQHMHTL